MKTEQTTTNGEIERLSHEYQRTTAISREDQGSMTGLQPNHDQRSKDY